MAADPVGTRETLAGLAVVLPVQELGGIPSPAPAPHAPASSDDSYPKEWLEGRAGAQREQGGRVTIAGD